MSPHAYTEAWFVEQPAIGLFAELGCVVGRVRRQLLRGTFTGKLLTADGADHTDRKKKKSAPSA